MARRCSISKLVLLAFFLGLMARGTQQGCPDDDLHVKQEATGKTVNNKPEWRVVVSNDCFCTELDVKLFCKNFQTVEKVDSNVFVDQGDGTCLVRNDPFNPRILPHTSVTFTYAWDTQFPFSIVSHRIQCS